MLEDAQGDGFLSRLEEDVASPTLKEGKAMPKGTKRAIKKIIPSKHKPRKVKVVKKVKVVQKPSASRVAKMKEADGRALAAKMALDKAVSAVLGPGSKRRRPPRWRRLPP